MASAILIGCTGLVGSHILRNLISSEAITSINTFSRRRSPEASSSDKVHAFVASDPARWLAQITRPSGGQRPAILFSAFGTTRAAVGGSFEAQSRIDHSLQLELARAARQAGCRVCVLVSSSFASERSWVPYARMKGRIEADLKALQFEKTVILRPGVILGDRGESRPGEWLAQGLVRGIGIVAPSWGNALGQDAGVIAEAALRTGLRGLEGGLDGGDDGSGVLLVERSDIVKIARMEPVS
ncbi:NAD dependent epimerase/dehydratase family protein [Aspergillus aculeatinus CBS 121060]|uniref:NAD dependent epimerase/dehydratase family protein n=1 Tax=Aspergillus aculeatinus CBS 121060 TaxID=1448322 RepID=A0ACD1GXP0_9EURO|nr:NAD dependent epimerase/dehydratase family protein [Aspergillus aculeatinus CBS 121060]RAH66082.1 NAD dependent epimerase/dehydratase family protein [Aspergillus aculeatinus CBS 121060]